MKLTFLQVLAHEGLSLDFTRPIEICQADADAMKELAKGYPHHAAKLYRKSREMMDACRAHWLALEEE